MPINYLFRHSIELFLKSLIIIFHKQLKISYGDESFDSTKPMIFTDGQWRNLYTCHWIDELYNYWLNELLLKSIEELNSLAPKGDWREKKDISSMFTLISSYDRDSSFFRYPVTKNTSLDPKKYTMQPLDMEKLEDLSKYVKEKSVRTKRGGIITLFKNSKNEIVGGYEKIDDVLEKVTEALRKVSKYFFAIHVMTRETLCNGK
ncbi:MAG: hypothetical protein HQ554_01640 [FCB group bacterium]|nr:hypothetical protein [FCB group bacterium]